MIEVQKIDLIEYQNLKTSHKIERNEYMYIKVNVL